MSGTWITQSEGPAATALIDEDERARASWRAKLRTLRSEAVMEYLLIAAREAALATNPLVMTRQDRMVAMAGAELLRRLESV